MDFDILEDFLAVLEHGSILAAAEASGTSQPTLSRRIRDLEDSLGVLLFNRTSRGISPTVYGSMFKQHAEAMLRDRQLALDELKALKSGVHGHARIGLAPAFSGYLPRVIRDLLEQKSGVTFEVVEGTYDALVGRTLKGEIEGAFTMLPPGESMELLAVRRLLDEPILIAVDPAHPLTRLEYPNSSDLESEPWIVMNRPRSIVDGFHQLAAEQGLANPNIAIETSSLDFLKSVIRGSKLLTALPQGAIHSELIDGSLKALPLKNLPKVQTAFVHRHGVMPPLVSEVLYEVEATAKRMLAASSH